MQRRGLNWSRSVVASGLALTNLAQVIPQDLQCWLILAVLLEYPHCLGDRDASTKRKMIILNLVKQIKWCFNLYPITSANQKSASEH